MLRKMQSPNVLMISWMPFRMFAPTFDDLLGDLFFPISWLPKQNHQIHKNTFCERSLSEVWGTGTKACPKANIANAGTSPCSKGKYIDSRLLKKGSIFHWGEIIFQTTYSFGVPAVSFRECRMFEDCRCLKILNQSEEVLAISLSYSLTKTIIYNSGEAVKAYKAYKDR